VDIQYIKTSILEAKRSEQVLFFKNIMPATPSWGDFIQDLNINYNNNVIFDSSDKRFNNSVLIYNKLDPISFINTFLIKINSINLINKLDGICNLANSIDVGYIKSIINFVGNESKYYIHADSHDVISWHCIGSVEWRIYKTLKQENPPPIESSEPYESYILNPGDILFVPSGIVHQVVVTEPRASILLNCYI
jgi:hypothetical protein